MSYFGTTDPMLEISRDNMSGISHINKFGRNADIDAATDPEDIWDGGGLYVPPTAARTHQIKSTSAQDAGTLVSTGTITTENITQIIDTGATFVTDSVAIDDIVLNDDLQDHSLVVSIDSETQLTVRDMHHGLPNGVGETYRIVTPAGTGGAIAHVKKGLDSNMDEVTEFIILNGTTNVATTTAYLRINRMHIHGAGSDGTNAGVITATADTDTTVTAQINTGNGQTLMAFFTIPRGKDGYITQRYSTLNRATKISDAMANMTLRENLWGDAAGGSGDGAVITDNWGIAIDGGSGSRDFKPYKKVSEFSDIWMRCESVTDDNSDIAGGFDIILVDK